MADAKVEQEKIIAEDRAEQVLRQDQLMAEIDVSRTVRNCTRPKRNCARVYNNLINAPQGSEV